MRNKILKIAFCFVLFSTLLITASFATSIKENVKDYQSSGAYIIGSTRFSTDTTITASVAAKAGVNEAKLNLALGKSIDNLEMPFYYYNKNAKAWYEVGEEVKQLTTSEDIEKVESNLNIFFVDNTEKTLEVEYTGDVDKNSLPSNVEYKDGKFIVPATTFNFTFEDSNGVETKINTNVDTNLKSEVGKEPEKVEIKRNPEVKFELAKEIVIGEATEFTVSTIANDYAGLMVVGTGSVNPDNVLKLEYAVGDQWIEMTGESIFGNAGAGFPLQDATSKFRVTFDKAGEYDVTFAIKNLETDKIMADVATKTNVITTKNVNTSEELKKAIANNYITDIKLTDNIELSKQIVVTKAITLDFNGKKITVAEDLADISAILVLEGGDLIITGNGTLNSASQGNNYSIAVWAKETGKATIKNGTFTNVGAKSKTETGANNNEMIYVSGSGVITIEDGIFVGNTENEKWGTRYTLNAHDTSYNAGTAKIIVKGGTYTNFDPANNLAEGEGTNFLAEGYKSVKEGDTYKVLPYDANDVTDESELRALIAEGGTITLGGDIDLKTAVVVSTKVTINLNEKTLTAKTDTVGDGIFTVVTGGDLTINGEGTIDSACQTNDYSMAIWAKETGKVTINGGTYTNVGAKSLEDQDKDGDGELDPNNNELIYARDSAQIVINDGTFIGNTSNKKYGARFTLNLRDQDNEVASIIVKGGTFKGYDPADSKSENPTANLVAEGYVSELVEGKDLYVVSKATAE